ncbi:TPA: four helix bundle protein [Patescibacteria group bacterium]|nr:four helix bundle protein [Patescibacteria group bacterium]
MANAYKGYRNLKAWEKANKLAHLVYDATENFPKSEIFGLTSQMRRAALSVPANIAEGYMRSSQKDRKHFYNIALASLSELEYYIDFALERKFYKDNTHNQLTSIQTETGKVLTGLIKSFNKA